MTDKDGNYTLTGLTDDTYQVGQYKIGENNNDWAATSGRGDNVIYLQKNPRP